MSAEAAAEAFVEEPVRVEVIPEQAPALRRILAGPAWTPAGYWCRHCLRVHPGEPVT